MIVPAARWSDSPRCAGGIYRGFCPTPEDRKRLACQRQRVTAAGEQPRKASAEVTKARREIAIDLSPVALLIPTSWERIRSTAMTVQPRIGPVSPREIVEDRLRRGPRSGPPLVSAPYRRMQISVDCPVPHPSHLSTMRTPWAALFNDGDYHDWKDCSYGGYRRGGVQLRACPAGIGDIASRRRRGAEQAGHRRGFRQMGGGRDQLFQDVLHDDVVWTIEGSSPSAGEFRGLNVFIDKAVRPFVTRLKTPVRPREVQVGRWPACHGLLERRRGGVTDAITATAMPGSSGCATAKRRPSMPSSI